MKKFISILLILCVSRTFEIYAQNSSCAQYEGRPMPDWVMGATPEPQNNSYYYKVFEGANQDREVARNQAVKKAFQQAMTFISVGVKADEVFAAIDREGYDMNVISETFSIPIYFACEFAKKSPDGTKWIYWILCQIAVRGNIVPQFDTHYSNCNTHTIWDAEKENCMKGIAAEDKKINGRSLAASIFIPGAGQMMKHHYVEGSMTLIGEIILLGAGVGTYLGAKHQTSIMNSYGIDYATYQSAQKARPIYRGVSYTCFGLAAVLYGVNLWRAYSLKPKQQQYAFYPAIIPVDNNNNYAFGLGANIKF